MSKAMPTPKSVRLTSKTRGRGVGRHVTLRPSSGGGLVTTGVKAKTLPKTLREEFSIYAIDTGRVCVAALNSRNVDDIAAAVANVIR